MATSPGGHEDGEQVQSGRAMLDTRTVPGLCASCGLENRLPEPIPCELCDPLCRMNFLLVHWFPHLLHGDNSLFLPGVL